jgi:hypothetical protein
LFRIRRLVFFTILVTGAVVPALAQDSDPPGRVARLGYSAGSVSFTPAGLQDPILAEVNRPVTTGDRLWSQADGRGELQTQNATIRFGGRTSIAIEDLSDRHTQIRLESGALSIRLHTLAPDEDFEIDMPQFSFKINRLGAYRAETGEKGEWSAAAVRFGNADVYGSDGAVVAVPPSKQARATMGGNPRIEAAPAIDELEAWSIDRDRREDLAATAHYVSRDIPGYADLDEYGSWRTVDQYGAVWFPKNMDADWAPYRSGHFVWSDSFGMNWVDGAQWGFGPLHYGRWKQINGEWGWIPGTAGKSAAAGGGSETFAVRPSYAPALVGWAAFAPGVVRADAVVGWFPLGPGEPWAPGFRASPEYISRVNLSNTAMADPAVLVKLDPARVNYMYRDVAMTALGHDDLAAGRMVGRDFVHVPQAAYAQAAVGAQPALEPTREARRGPRPPAAGAPPEIANRPVVEHRMASAKPSPFVPREAQPQGAQQASAPSALRQAMTVPTQAPSQAPLQAPAVAPGAAKSAPAGHPAAIPQRAPEVRKNPAADALKTPLGVLKGAATGAVKGAGGQAKGVNSTGALPTGGANRPKALPKKPLVAPKQQPVKKPAA